MCVTFQSGKGLNAYTLIASALTIIPKSKWLIKQWSFCQKLGILSVITAS